MEPPGVEILSAGLVRCVVVGKLGGGQVCLGEICAHLIQVGQLSGATYMYSFF